MPPKQSVQERRREKIKAVLASVKDNNWKSMNDFLLAFYNSDDGEVCRQAARSLTYKPNERFGPNALLDAWLERVPNDSKKHLRRTLTEKVAGFLVQESSAAIKDNSLRFASQRLDIPYLTSEFALRPLLALYKQLLPCLWLLLFTVISAQNNYERRKGREKLNKEQNAARVIVVIISMMLFARNRATNAFQVVIGIFLASAGASRRVLDTCNHMALSVSYSTVQRCLVTLSESAKAHARTFCARRDRLFAVVYDNINFTLRKASQRLDSRTQQLNATTSAVFSLPSNFTRAAYQTALSIAERAKRAGGRQKMTARELAATATKQTQLAAAFKYHVSLLLLKHSPGFAKHTPVQKRLYKYVKKLKPRVRVLSHEKTEFFPLPTLDQEEASVAGTIKVVTRIFHELLGFAVEVIDTELRLMVGDWLTIRNLRLMKAERVDEFSSFERMDWVQEVAMPFHFQLNAMYMLFRTHIGHANDNDPGSLEHHRQLLRCAKLDTSKPEYNKAKELLRHSLIARILDCTRTLLGYTRYDDLKSWQPSPSEFGDLVVRLVTEYATTSTGQATLESGDEVLAHAIFFLRDALIFEEFNSAVHDADVGRMHTVYSFWLFMMRGARCHNYGNELLELKAQFKYELPELLGRIVERTWLVNRWGKRGRSIPTDLYLEHNNGFTKNMFAAQGSCASMDHVQRKSSACVEVLRALAHEVTGYFGVTDHHRRHQEVSIRNDIKALCTDMEQEQLHQLTRNRRVPPVTMPKRRKTKGNKMPWTSTSHVTGVRDVLEEGRKMLNDQRMFLHWKARTGKGGTDLYGGDGDAPGDGVDGLEDLDDLVTGTIFDDPEGSFEVDTSQDSEFANECPFSNVDITHEEGDD